MSNEQMDVRRQRSLVAQKGIFVAFSSYRILFQVAFNMIHILRHLNEQFIMLQKKKHISNNNDEFKRG